MAGESQKEPTSGAPDPSVLTTESLQREVKVLRDLIKVRVKGLDDIFDERLKSIDMQLKLIERQRVENKADTKAAVDAALAAAKEAVKEQTTAAATAITKSEGGTAEALKALGTTTSAAIAGVTANHSDLKERVAKIETAALTTATNTTETRAEKSITLAQVALMFTILGFALSVVVVVAVQMSGK